MLAFEIKDDVLCQLEEKAALKNAVQELTQALSWLHVSLENLNKTGLKKEAQRLKRLTETASRLQSDLILTRVF